MLKLDSESLMGQVFAERGRDTGWRVYGQLELTIAAGPGDADRAVGGGHGAAGTFQAGNPRRDLE